MRGADQQLGPRTPLCGEQGVEIGFTIRDGNHLNVVRNSVLCGRQSRQPALAFLLRRFPFGALVFLAERGRITNPDCLIDQAQRHAVGGGRQGRM